MSVGPKPILVYRADGTSASRGLVIKRHSSTKLASPEPPIAISAIRVQHRLVLTEKQKAKLRALFMAPKALAKLMNGYSQPLKNEEDASAFLLTNRKELDGFINPEKRKEEVDLLKELLLKWAASPPESIGIDFDDVSLTSDQKIYLPLDGLRAVEVQSPTSLIKERKGRIFTKPFTLFEQDKHFCIAFTLEPKAYAKPAQTKPKEIKLRPGQTLPYISGRRDAPIEPRQRILFSKYSGVFTGGLKTMNWDGLSGWGVNGGAPSLGKHSR